MLEMTLYDKNNQKISISTIAVDHTYIDIILTKGLYKVNVNKVFNNDILSVQCLQLGIEVK